MRSRVHTADHPSVCSLLAVTRATTLNSPSPLAAFATTHMAQQDPHSTHTVAQEVKEGNVDPEATALRYLAYARNLRSLVLASTRYLAYTSDVGEAFRPVVHPKLVTASYGISWLYVLGDVAYEGYSVCSCPLRYLTFPTHPHHCCTLFSKDHTPALPRFFSFLSFLPLSTFLLPSFLLSLSFVCSFPLMFLFSGISTRQTERCGRSVYGKTSHLSVSSFYGVARFHYSYCGTLQWQTV